MMELFLVIVPSGGGGKLGIVYGCTGGVGYIMDKWGTGLTTFASLFYFTSHQNAKQ
jgi:hypothetical protein